ncbi:MAG: hypothetical protein QM730_24085 [Anaerolineales bacterium]
MPWLTYHMAWPMVLFTGWAVGQIIELIPPFEVGEKPVRIGLTILVMTVFVVAAFNVFRSIFGATPPFQGTDLGQLEATGKFIFPLVSLILSGVLLAYLMRNDYVSLGMVGLLILAIITLETSVINGATMMMLTSTPDIAQATITLSQVKFAAALLALVGSIAGIVLLGQTPTHQRLLPICDVDDLRLAGCANCANRLPRQLHQLQQCYRISCLRPWCGRGQGSDGAGRRDLAANCWWTECHCRL